MQTILIIIFIVFSLGMALGTLMDNYKNDRDNKQYKSDKWDWE